MRPLKILIVRLSSLGDIVHGLPVAAALRRALPDACIDWLVEKRFAGIVELSSPVDHVVPLDLMNPLGSANTFNVVGRLRSAHYDWAIDIQGLVKSAVFAKSSGARRVIGFHKDHLRDKSASRFYSELYDPSPYTHVIEKNMGLLKAIGFKDNPTEFPMNVPPASTLSNQNSGFGIIHIGGSKKKKIWSAIRMGKVAFELFNHYRITPLIVHGPGEDAIAKAAVYESRGTARVTPTSSLQELVRTISGARIFIGGDSGPIHIAAALGIAVVGIYGPTNPARNGPWNQSHSVVSGLHSCQHCYGRTCWAKKPCLGTIEVNDVMTLVDKILSRKAASARHDPVKML